MKKELLIDSHVSMSAPDYLVGSLNEALSYKANAFMIYTGAPQNSKRVELSKLKIDEFKVKLKENNIAIENVIVHAPYIINLASVNPYKHKIAIDVLKNEIIRTNTIDHLMVFTNKGKMYRLLVDNIPTVLMKF